MTERAVSKLMDLDKSAATDAIDLSNVDYDDILQLYRGWKKSEGALRDKNKELQLLKERLKHLQESHTKFRGQIQALDSVKELTLSLQSQVSMLQQENSQLGKDNKELSDLNSQAEELLKERITEESKQAKLLRDVQMEFARLRGRYEELVNSQKGLETLAADEQAMRMSTEARLSATENTLEELKSQNQTLREKLESSIAKTALCDDELAHASEQLNILSKEITTMTTTRDQLCVSQAENGILVGDISRLIRLLDHYPAAKTFVQQWEEKQNSHFTRASAVTDQDRPGSAKPTRDTINASIFDEDLYQALHISRNESRNRAYADLNDNGDNEDISPSHLIHLKRLHGGADPFPLTDNWEDEQQFWVPREAARLGADFLTTKIPHASPEVIMEFLRKMNKIWLRREKRKVTRVKEVYETKVEELKRKLANARPYKSVIAESEIRRLQSQVHHEKKKRVKSRRRDSFEFDFTDLGFEQNSQTEHFQGNHTPSKTTASRNSKTPQPLSHSQRPLSASAALKSSSNKSTLRAVSTEKLLEASLMSLEKYGQEITASQSIKDEEIEHMRDSLVGVVEKYPSESYLRGAMKIGNNLTELMEELADRIEDMRSKHLAEVSSAYHDEDQARAIRRLNLLATTVITNAVSEVNKIRAQARELIENNQHTHGN